MVQDRTWGNRLYDGINTVLLLLIALVTIIPFVYLIIGSFTSSAELLQKGFVLFPSQWSLDAYKYIFSTQTLIRSLMVSVFITVMGTLVNLAFTVTLAYPLARKDFDGRRAMSLMVVFSMLFSGGLIPSYLVVKELGLLNSYWSLLLPGAINAFNLIVMRSFFQQLPEGLEESAKIDGCNDLGILVKIVLPLSMPAIATFSLFYAVGHWNTFFNAILYINDNTKWPVQVLLRQIVIMSQGGIGDTSAFSEGFVPPAQSVKMAVIIVSTIPILLVYPFLQKHFSKGALLGSVKG